MEQRGFAVAGFRDGDEWRCEALPPAVLADLGVLISALRSQVSEGGPFVIASVDDEFFLIARQVGPRTVLLLSDLTASVEYPLAAQALERLGEEPPEDDELDEVWPVGDLYDEHKDRREQIDGFVLKERGFGGPLLPLADDEHFGKAPGPVAALARVRHFVEGVVAVGNRVAGPGERRQTIHFAQLPAPAGGGLEQFTLGIDHHHRAPIGEQIGDDLGGALALTGACDWRATIRMRLSVKQDETAPCLG